MWGRAAMFLVSCPSVYMWVCLINWHEVEHGQNFACWPSLGPQDSTRTHTHTYIHAVLMALHEHTDTHGVVQIGSLQQRQAETAAAVEQLRQETSSAQQALMQALQAQGKASACSQCFEKQFRLHYRNKVLSNNDKNVINVVMCHIIILYYIALYYTTLCTLRSKHCMAQKLTCQLQTPACDLMALAIRLTVTWTESGSNTHVTQGTVTG